MILVLVDNVAVTLEDGTRVIKNLFLQPSQYSIPRVLFEAYMTDEESFEPYIPLSSYTTEEEDTEEDTEEETTEETEEETEETSEEEDTEGFSLHQGEILETYYYQGLTETSWEDNYEDIDTSGSLKLSEIIDLDRLYKGVRCLLNTENQSPNKTITYEDLQNTLLGFITEETFNESGMELSISGMSKLMEEDYQFNFTQMKRSDIIIEVIKTAGLKPEVDPTGLNDEVIDYTNISSDSSSDDDTGTGDTTGVSTDVVTLAKQVCKGKSGARDKANAICNWIGTNIDYPHPNYSNHQKCPAQVLSSKLCNCCDRARLGYQMGKVVGLTGKGVHGPGHVWVQYQINGQWVNSDPSTSRKSIGVVWKNLSVDREWEFPDC